MTNIKEELQKNIDRIRGMVADFPKDTPQICRLVVDYFIELLMGYQEWVQELQKTIQQQDADLQKMQKTIEIQVESLRKQFQNNVVQ